MTQQDIKDGKGLAVLSYITVIGIIIAYFLNIDKKNSFTAFHLRQSIGLWLTYFIIAWVISFVNSWTATAGFWVFFIVLFIYGLSSAILGKTQAVPLLGNLFQKWFANIGR